MTSLEWAMQALLILLLAAALPLLLRVGNGIAAIRRDPAALADAAGSLGTAVREAEAALDRMRAAGAEGAASLTARIAAAEALHDDLRQAAERADPLADRLAALVAAARPLAASSSRAERDLLHALGRDR